MLHNQGFAILSAMLFLKHFLSSMAGVASCMPRLSSFVVNFSGRCSWHLITIYEEMAKKRKKPVGQPPLLADSLEIIEFVDPNKRKIAKSSSHNPKPEKKTKTFDPTSFDFRKASHEVFKFGTSGLKEKDKLDANIAHAIKLGAKVSSLCSF